MNYNRALKLLYENTQGVYLLLKNIQYLFTVPRSISRIPVDQRWGFQLLTNGTYNSILDDAEILYAPLGTALQFKKLQTFNFYDMKTNSKILPFHLLKYLLQLVHDRSIYISLQFLYCLIVHHRYSGTPSFFMFPKSDISSLLWFVKTLNIVCFAIPYKKTCTIEKPVS